MSLLSTGESMLSFPQRPEIPIWPPFSKIADWWPLNMWYMARYYSTYVRISWAWRGFIRSLPWWHRFWYKNIELIHYPPCAALGTKMPLNPDVLFHKNEIRCSNCTKRLLITWNIVYPTWYCYNSPRFLNNRTAFNHFKMEFEFNSVKYLRIPPHLWSCIHIFSFPGCS